jgi:hypothetical protein
MKRIVKPVYVNICLINFLTRMVLKNRSLLPLFFNFILEYAVRKVQENQVGLKLNGTHQLLIYSDDMTLLRIIEIP